MSRQVIAVMKNGNEFILNEVSSKDNDVSNRSLFDFLQLDTFNWINTNDGCAMLNVDDISIIYIKEFTTEEDIIGKKYDMLTKNDNNIVQFADIEFLNNNGGVELICTFNASTFKAKNNVGYKFKPVGRFSENIVIVITDDITNFEKFMKKNKIKISEEVLNDEFQRSLLGKTNNDIRII